ncbi:biotin synthase BioB [Anaerosporobacter sp.]|uniref:biotin synthase BioB n=1 Tax=Anaerosporobacter sp. TaxID=1872529 RepID=UPI00286F3CC1|nr:biotin synthase BioB [Anaerosporobacter sp.]
MISLLEQVLHGHRLKEEEARLLMNAEYTPLDELVETAKMITRNYYGNNLELCAIRAARVGRCSGDCAYCSQSTYNKSDVTFSQVQDMNVDELVEQVLELQKCGVSRYSLVTSGELLSDSEFEQIIAIYKRLHRETNMNLCASLGSLNKERAQRLVEVGVIRYHHNIETARSFFPSICSTHSYEDKLSTIRIAKEVGLEVCCGGIISMGETAEQRVEMACALRELDIDCVPINILNPIKGTRLETQQLLSVNDILRTIAVFRLILPHKTLRFAGGRQNAMKEEEYAGYEAGINALMVGNFLTTDGKDMNYEIEKLVGLGYSIESI